MSTSVCIDHKGNAFLIPTGLPCAIICCPCVVTAQGFSEKQKTTDDKICFVISSAIAGGCIGAGCGAIAGGIGAGPAFGVGLVVGAAVAIIKVIIDELR